MPVGETNGKGWASDGNLLKVAGLIIGALVGGYYLSVDLRQNTADTNITAIQRDVSAIKGDVGILGSKMDYQGRSIDAMGNRLSIVEQQGITTRDNLDALKEKVETKQTNILEKKLRTKDKEKDIALTRQQKSYDRQIARDNETIRDQAAKIP